MGSLSVHPQNELKNNCHNVLRQTDKETILRSKSREGPTLRERTGAHAWRPSQEGEARVFPAVRKEEEQWRN